MHFQFLFFKYGKPRYFDITAAQRDIQEARSRFKSIKPQNEVRALSGSEYWELNLISWAQALKYGGEREAGGVERVELMFGI